MAWYCDAAPGHQFHGPYHDSEYGFPTDDETILFERLAMEIMQAGLSWLTILKKRDGLNSAFDGFDIDHVAAYGDTETARLLADAGIIRNRLKIAAIIENAKRVRAMRDSHGGFAAWIAAHHPKPKAEWVKLFKKTFKFTGGEITGEFLMSTGYLPGVHRPDCPTYAKIADLNPPWVTVDSKIYAPE
jgi:DNA-3-methyladenine glycosylase I